jgi:hypothetical protein
MRAVLGGQRERGAELADAIVADPVGEVNGRSAQAIAYYVRN